MKRRSFFLPTLLVVAISGFAGAQQAATTAPQATPPAEASRALHKKHHMAHETQADLEKEAKISMDAAKVTAMATVPGATIQSSELEREHGSLIYSFDMKVAGQAGIEEVNIDAVTGKVLKQEHEDPKAEKREKQQEKHEKAAKKSR
ncbi:MAG: hypothetical protein NVS4B3_04810 [Gemmatimonadaceae bacterium]